MDYETGISTSPADLLSRLETFAAANGWTVSTPTSGKVFSKGGAVVGVGVDSTNVYARGATAYNAAVAYNAQTNNPGYSVQMNCGAGPFTAYHFFAGAEGTDGEGLHIVVEFTAGRYRHMTFGRLVKFGVYTGGTYVDAVYWEQSVSFSNSPTSGQHRVIGDANTNLTSIAGHVYADFDSKTNNWIKMLQSGVFTTTAGIGNVRTQGIGDNINLQGYQAWNLRNIINPVLFFANRASSLRSPVGRVPNMRLVGLQNLGPAETTTVGGVDWKVFPIAQRSELVSPPSGFESSGYYGYAYRLP